LNLSFKMAMPSIVNQEIVIFGQRLAEVIKDLATNNFPFQVPSGTAR